MKIPTNKILAILDIIAVVAAVVVVVAVAMGSTRPAGMAMALRPRSQGRRSARGRPWAGGRRARQARARDLGAALQAWALRARPAPPVAQKALCQAASGPKRAASQASAAGLCPCCTSLTSHAHQAGGAYGDHT